MRSEKNGSSQRAIVGQEWTCKFQHNLANCKGYSSRELLRALKQRIVTRHHTRARTSSVTWFSPSSISPSDAWGLQCMTFLTSPWIRVHICVGELSATCGNLNPDVTVTLVIILPHMLVVQQTGVPNPTTSFHWRLVESPYRHFYKI